MTTKRIVYQGDEGEDYEYNVTCSCGNCGCIATQGDKCEAHYEELYKLICTVNTMTPEARDYIYYNFDKFKEDIIL